MDFGFCFSFPLFRIHVQSFQLQMGVPFFVLFLSMILNVLQYNKQQQLKHFTFRFVCGTFKFESMCVDTSINASEKKKKSKRKSSIIHTHLWDSVECVQKEKIATRTFNDCLFLCVLRDNWMKCKNSCIKTTLCDIQF